MSSFKTDIASGRRAVPNPESGAAIEVVIPIAWDQDGNASFSSGDIVALVEIPPGVKVVDYMLSTDDIDTGTTAAASFGVLNADGTDLAITFKSGISVFQSGGVHRCDVQFTDVASSSSRRLGLKFTGASTGSLSGKVGRVLLKLVA